MRAKTAARLSWGLLGLFFALGLAGTALATANTSAVGDDLLIIPVVAIVSGVGALIASKRPENAIGWILLVFGLGAVVGFVSNEYARFAVERSLGPLWVAQVAAVLSTVIWLPTFGLIPTFLLLLFPDGRLPSPRWRPVTWFVVALMALGTLGAVLEPGPLDVEGVTIQNPLGVEEMHLPWLEAAFFPMLVAAILACFAGLLARFLRSRGDERLQIRGFIRAAVVAVVAFSMGDQLPELLANLLFWVGLGSLAGSIAVGVLRYRLYEIDLVVRKTLVYGVLTTILTGLYLLVVVALPSALLHPTTSQQTIITVAATVALTLGLLPLRRRATRLANRLVYGKRATPYEVLSEFSDRLGGAYSTEEVLPRMARLIVEGTGASRASVWLRLGGAWRLEAVWPADAEVGRSPEEAGAEVFDVTHGDDRLGALALVKPPSDPVTPEESKLVRELAGQAGLVLRNVALVEDLRASRQRLVEAQDAERRRLERDIHDGAQQHLVALAVKLRLLEGLIDKDSDRARTTASDLKAQAGEALETLRDLARGIYPPLLADQGLPAALEAAARKSTVEVVISPNGAGRYSQAVEAAVYFCVLEALQNVAKYSGANRAEVRLSAGPGELRFEVHDDGRGFDPATLRPGSGMQNMADRLAALGGSLDTTSAPGEGTTVAGRLPVSP